MKKLSLAILIIVILAASCIVAQNLTLLGAGGPSAPTTVTLGNTSTGSTYAPGYQAAALLPIYTPSWTSGAMASFTINVSSSAQLNMGVYSSTTGGNCPSGATYCAGTLMCSYSSVTPGTGIHTYNVSNFTAGCGSGAFAGRTIYWLAVQGTGGAPTMNATSGSFCPGTGYFGLHSGAIGAGSLPSTMTAQDEPSAAQCITVSATFNCTGGCGVAPTPWTAFTYAGQSSGATVTTANMVSGSACLNGPIATNTQLTNTTYTNSQTQGFLASPVCNGSSISSGSLSISRPTANTDEWHYTYNTGTSGSTQMVQLTWLYHASMPSVSSNSQFDLEEIDSSNTTTFGIYTGTGSGFCSGSGTPPCFKVERSGGSGGTTYWGDIPYTMGNWYALVLYNSGTLSHEAAVYNTSGVQLTNYLNGCSGATNNICITNTGSGSPTGIKEMNCGSGVGNSEGTVIYGPVLLDPTGLSFSSIGTTYGDVFFPDGIRVLGKRLWAMVNKGLIKRAEIRTIHGHSGWWSYALNEFLT